MRRKEFGGLSHMHKACGSLDTEIIVRLPSSWVCTVLDSRLSSVPAHVSLHTEMTRKGELCLTMYLQSRSTPSFPGGIIQWKCTEAKS